jgi:aminoglycoside 6'-N-acetyltransferase I
MARYAPFDPTPSTRHRLEPTLRRATPDDAAAIAALEVERHGGDPLALVPQIRAHLSRPDSLVWAAEADGVVGFSRLAWYDPYAPPFEGSRGVPVGHYLVGLLVAERARRCGVGQALTRVRLDWIEQQGAREAYYFANESNAASIALHRAFGFTELTRDFHFAKAHFPQGGGVLFGARW